MATDPALKDRKSLIKKFRKVIPPTLGEPTLIVNQRSTARSTTVTSGLELFTGEWNEASVNHLLRRTLFGVTKIESTQFQALTLDQSVAQLLAPVANPAPPVNNYNGINGIVDPHAALGDTFVTAPRSNEHEGYRITALKGWWLKNIIHLSPTIHEKMIFFWHNLLVTQWWDIFNSKASYKYISMLRRNALGNYKTMIKELTLDPSMLLYLNGTYSKKEAPDENYGRELQELFCIGKGSGSQYTEGDVQAAARLFTGWMVDWNSFETEGEATSYFDPNNHDTANKIFSAFYGNRVIVGRAGQAGEEELDELLDMIFDNPETAKYICRRIYSFFVYSEIDSTTEANVIEPLAEIFRVNNFEILPVLSALLKSAHFHDVENRGVLIKGPLEHTLGIWRTLGLDSPAPDNLLLDYALHASILWHCSGMGLEIGDPPSVAGWPSYYQTPQYDKAWITTDTIVTRAQTTDSMLYWGFWVTNDIQIKADIVAFIKTFNNSANPNTLIDEASALLLGLPLSQSQHDSLKSILLSGQQSDSYWSNAWSNYLSNEANQEYKNIVLTRLQSMFQRLLQTGEYHLM
jgi:uncharacterized protein (DUF1800 family)